MKYIICLVFLMLPCAAEATRWKFLGFGSDVTDKLYYDPTFIRANNGIYNVWILLDYSKPRSFVDVHGIKSSVWLFSIDCNQGKHALLAANEYSGSMSSGNALSSMQYSMEEDDWKYIVPGTSISLVSEVVCPVNK